MNYLFGDLQRVEILNVTCITNQIGENYNILKKIFVVNIGYFLKIQFSALGPFLLKLGTPYTSSESCGVLL